MTGQIIPLHADEHREAQLLLPWYATGRLDAADHARVEAHLSACAECQADLALERRLSAAVADLPVEAAPGWEALKARLPRQAAARPARRPTAPRGLLASLGGWRPGAQTLGWTAALQFVLLLGLTGVLLLRPLQPAQTPPAADRGPAYQAPAYQALGATPAPTPGNLIVIFRPDTPEQGLRAILNASHARLVDGPTAADAYVLHVAPAERAAVLTRLRARREVVLAEPIDAGVRP